MADSNSDLGTFSFVCVCVCVFLCDTGVIQTCASSMHLLSRPEPVCDRVARLPLRDFTGIVGEGLPSYVQI